MFNLFGSKQTEETKNLLKNAQADFDFDQKGVKTRLLSSIEEHQLSTAERLIRERTHKSFMRRHKLASAASFVLLIVVGAGATLARADISNPGDRFHTLDQWGERVILKLPLTENLKTRMQVNMVDERTRELDHLLELEANAPVKTHAVDDSRRTLQQAIEVTQSIKERSITNGNQTQTEKMDAVLARLEALAEAQEQKVEGLWKQESNEEVKKELKQQIEQIRKSKLNARNRDKDSNEAAEIEAEIESAERN